jgi:AP-1-like transcription factor
MSLLIIALTYRKKRKAQNRAAQRAFRERKEKHLKDLETKVQDLEKASESANHENSILRAQIEKLTVELREYKKRLSLGINGRSPPLNQHGLPPYLAGQGPGLSNPNDVNFQFEFPKFGKLPGLPVLNVSRMSSSSTTSPPAPAHRSSSSSNNGSVSPLDKSRQNTTSSSKNNLTQNAQLFPQLEGTDVSDFSTLFPSGNLDSMSSDKLINFGSTGTRSSEDSSRRQNSTGQSTSYSSPSASSNVGSNAGLSSSCGTSPEPFTQSPSTFKPNDNVLSTIGEEHPSGISEGEKSFYKKLGMACGDAKNPVPRTLSENIGNSGLFDASNFDINGIDWLAQQNNNQFDPELFGDYREPQNNILSGGLYDDSFFADAFPMPDLSSPFNMAPNPAFKKDLVTEIDQKLSEEDDVVPCEDRKTLLTCNTMW